MSLAEPPVSTKTRDATPGVDAGQTALRLAVGRYTVDVVSAGDQLAALVGAGVGTEPEPVAIGGPHLAALLTVADRADERTAWGTSWWPATV